MQFMIFAIILQLACAIGLLSLILTECKKVNSSAPEGRGLSKLSKFSKNSGTSDPNYVKTQVEKAYQQAQFGSEKPSEIYLSPEGAAYFDMLNQKTAAAEKELLVQDPAQPSSYLHHSFRPAGHPDVLAVQRGEHPTMKIKE